MIIVIQIFQIAYFCQKTIKTRLDNSSQGFFGIGIQNGKTPENLGVLRRSAKNLGASFIFTIGNRYQKQAYDTHKAVGAMPYFYYDTFDDFYKHLTKGALVVGCWLLVAGCKKPPKHSV